MRFFIKLQDLRDHYKSKTSEEKFKYYKTFPLDEKDLFGDTPIDILSNQKANPILLSILKGEYDFDNPNSIKNLTSLMSLHSTILSNNYDVIKAHLEMKIDINEISEENNNSYGLSPLGVACHILDLESVELLLKNGANPNLKNNDGQSAMDIAVENNNENLVNWLLTKI